MPILPCKRWLTFPRVAAACAFVSILGFAAPAVAQSKTLVCEVDTAGWGPFLFNVNYATGAISMGTMTSHASITEQDIRFRFQRDPHGNFVGSIQEGTINRIAGTINITLSMTDSGGVYATKQLQGRCREGTQKF
jgi:hypothetical protein